MLLPPSMRDPVFQPLTRRKPRADEAPPPFKGPSIHPSGKFVIHVDGMLETILPRKMLPETSSDFDMIRRDTPALTLSSGYLSALLQYTNLQCKVTFPRV